jgi:hypothetical protein
MGLELVAVFDHQSDGQFLGFPVKAIDDHKEVPYDMLIVAVLERPAGTLKRLRQAGVAEDRLLTLRPDVPGPASNGADKAADNGREQV